MKTFDKNWWSKILTEQVLDEIEVNKPKGGPSIYDIYEIIPEHILKDNAMKLTQIMDKYGLEFDGWFDEDQYNNLSFKEKTDLYNELKKLDLKDFLPEIEVNKPTKLEKWEIASKKIDKLRKEGKIYTKEYYLAYALYYEGLIEKNGDSNGYYSSQMRDYKQKAQNSLDEITINKSANLYDEFIKFVEQKLKLTDIKQHINLTQDKSDTETFAHFNPDTNEIVVYVKDRINGDWMRSLAHECVHYKQNQDGVLTPESGKTGHKHENEANSTAGVIMRDFGKLHPEIFTTKHEEQLDEIKVNKPEGKKGNIPLEYYTLEISKLINEAIFIMEKYKYKYISFVNRLNWIRAYRQGRYEEFNGVKELVLGDKLFQYSVMDNDLQQKMFQIGNELEDLSYENKRIEHFILDYKGKIWIGDKYNQIVYKKEPINEIKVNKPGSKLTVYIEPGYESQPYFLLKDGTKFFGYLGDNDFIEYQNVGWEFDELISHLNSKKVKYNNEDIEHVLIDKNDLNIQNEINEIRINKPGTPVIGEKYSLNFWGKDLNIWSPAVYEYKGTRKPTVREKTLHPEQTFYHVFKNGENIYEVPSTTKWKYWKEDINEIKINKPGIMSVEECTKLQDKIIDEGDINVIWSKPYLDWLWEYFDEYVTISIFRTPEVLFNNRKDLYVKYCNDLKNEVNKLNEIQINKPGLETKLFKQWQDMNETPFGGATQDASNWEELDEYPKNLFKAFVNLCKKYPKANIEDVNNLNIVLENALDYDFELYVWKDELIAKEMWDKEDPTIGKSFSKDWWNKTLFNEIEINKPNINEIEVNKPNSLNFKDPRAVFVEAVKETELYPENWLIWLLDLGPYYTPMPSETTSPLYLISKDAFRIIKGSNAKLDKFNNELEAMGKDLGRLLKACKEQGIKYIQ